MGDIKPIGSEKLQGDEKLKRILELTYFKDTNVNENKKSSTDAVFLKESVKGGFYGIVKEKDGYYVKKGITESTLDYIGGLFMKNKNRFSSYGEALKRLELLNGSEQINEATKYVLKKSGGSEETLAPSPEVSDDLPPLPDEGSSDNLPAPSPEGGEDLAPVSDDSIGGEESSKKSDYMAEIQKHSGKLGQALRDEKERLESDDIKYVINMILSAVDLEKLDDEDKEEIAKRFEPEEFESDGESDDEGSDFDLPPVEDDDDTESELGEVMDKLESFINTPIDNNEIDLSKYADISETNHNDEVEIDIEEIKNDIQKSIAETLGKYFK